MNFIYATLFTSFIIYESKSPDNSDVFDKTADKQ